MAAADLVTWEWDIARDEILYDGKNFRMTGLSVSEHMSFDRFLELVHPDDREPFRQAVRRARARG